MSACDSHFHPSNGGAAKVAYHSRGEAEAAIRTIRTRGRRAGVKPIRTYICEGCHRWFLTSSPA